MKRNWQRRAVLMIGLPVAVFLSIRGCYWYVQRPIYDADADALLRACRTLMALRGELPSVREGTPYGPALLETGSSEFATSVPAAVKALDPAYVAVWGDHILVCISPLPRTYVLAFSEDAEQYGTRRIIDGLWYYNGHSGKELGGLGANGR